MQLRKHLYTFIYNDTERALSKLESRCIFGEEDQNKILFSDLKVAPDSSAFIKRRLDISLSDNDYPALIDKIKAERIHVEGFKVEYLVLEDDQTVYADRLKKLKDIGYSIEGNPDYYHPTITYALCNYAGTWCFGQLIKDTFDWYKHKKKPYKHN